jgi:hypothetical protein
MDSDIRSDAENQIGKPFGAELNRLDLLSKSVAEIVSILKSPPIEYEDGIDDPLAHAPPVAPRPAPVAPESPGFTDAHPIISNIANTPPTAPGIGGANLVFPPLKSRPTKGEPAAGDAARQLSRDQRPVTTRLGRLSFARRAGVSPCTQLEDPRRRVPQSPRTNTVAPTQFSLNGMSVPLKNT